MQVLEWKQLVMTLKLQAMYVDTVKVRLWTCEYGKGIHTQLSRATLIRRLTRILSVLLFTYMNLNF